MATNPARVYWDSCGYGSVHPLIYLGSPLVCWRKMLIADFFYQCISQLFFSENSRQSYAEWNPNFLIDVSDLQDLTPERQGGYQEWTPLLTCSRPWSASTLWISWDAASYCFTEQSFKGLLWSWREYSCILSRHGRKWQLSTVVQLHSAYFCIVRVLSSVYSRQSQILRCYHFTAAAFGATWLTVPWLYPAELYPVSARAKGNAMGEENFPLRTLCRTWTDFLTISNTGVSGWSIGNLWATLLVPVMFANIGEVLEHMGWKVISSTADTYSRFSA